MVLVIIAVIIYFISLRPVPSTFLTIMDGLIWITAGVSWMDTDTIVWSDIILGVVLVAIGGYLLIMEGYDFLKSKLGG